MTKIIWDKQEERRFENGVDRGVLYLPDSAGKYETGVPWNGLTAVTEKPTGADATRKYADNINYVTLHAAEEFGGTIEAFTSPEEFDECDGTASPRRGVGIGQQRRKPFGFCYRTRVGNALDPEAGYKLHLVYGATAAPSERGYATVNDSPDAMSLSWDFTTTPVEVGTIDGIEYKPTGVLTIDSTKVARADLDVLEATLYGDAQGSAKLPLPADVIAGFTDAAPAAFTAEGRVLSLSEEEPAESMVATPQSPAYNATTHVLTVPEVAGVGYYKGDVLGDLLNAGEVTLTENTRVVAAAIDGYSFPEGVTTSWSYTV